MFRLQPFALGSFPLVSTFGADSVVVEETLEDSGENESPPIFLFCSELGRSNRDTDISSDSEISFETIATNDTHRSLVHLVPDTGDLIKESEPRAPKPKKNCGTSFVWGKEAKTDRDATKENTVPRTKTNAANSRDDGNVQRLNDLSALDPC